MTDPPSLAPETSLYRTRLSLLFAPFASLASQPHLQPTSVAVQCPSCHTPLVVGVNSSVWTQKGALWSRCEACKKVAKIGGGRDQKATQELHESRNRFQMVKKRRRIDVENADVRRREAEQKQQHAMEGPVHMNELVGREQDKGTTTSTSARFTPPVDPVQLTLSVAPPHPSVAPSPKAIPSISPSPGPSSSTSTRSNTPVTTLDDKAKLNKSSRKRSKQPSGLAELLQAKKKQNQVTSSTDGTGGRMDLSDFLQSM